MKKIIFFTLLIALFLKMDSANACQITQEWFDFKGCFAFLFMFPNKNNSKIYKEKSWSIKKIEEEINDFVIHKFIRMQSKINEETINQEKKIKAINLTISTFDENIRKSKFFIEKRESQEKSSNAEENSDLQKLNQIKEQYTEKLASKKKNLIMQKTRPSIKKKQ